MTTNPSLFERIGGAEAIESMVITFYRRVLTDSLLRPFFRHTDIDKLIAMQKELFTAALGGPLSYTGRPIYEVHEGHGIERRHFTRFVEHALTTLEEYGLTETEVNDVIGRLNTYVGDVSGIYGTTG